MTNNLAMICNTIEVYEAIAEKEGRDSVTLQLSRDDVWELLHYIYSAEQMIESGRKYKDFDIPELKLK